MIRKLLSRTLEIVMFIPTMIVGYAFAIAIVIHFYRHTYRTPFGLIYDPDLTRVGYGRR